MTTEEINAARAWLAERKGELPPHILAILEASLEASMEHILEKLEYDRHF